MTAQHVSTQCNDGRRNTQTGKKRTPGKKPQWKIKTNMKEKMYPNMIRIQELKTPQNAIPRSHHQSTKSRFLELLWRCHYHVATLPVINPLLPLGEDGMLIEMAVPGLPSESEYFLHACFKFDVAFSAIEPYGNMKKDSTTNTQRQFGLYISFPLQQPNRSHNS
jgi:hypothetical protein